MLEADTIIADAEARVGMADSDLQRVSNHSFRAGGATDYFVSGLSAERIKLQGGWSTYCFLIYVRPADEHRWRVASALLGALRRAVWDPHGDRHAR